MRDVFDSIGRSSCKEQVIVYKRLKRRGKMVAGCREIPYPSRVPETETADSDIVSPKEQKEN